MTGTLTTFQDSSSSLSCRGSVVVVNSVVVDVRYKGYPRPNVDTTWFSFYSNLKKGSVIGDESINSILALNGKNGLVSVFNHK